MTSAIRIQPLPSDLPRHHFACGNVALDAYFHRQVTQDIRRRVSACFIAQNSQDDIVGYYTLATASIPLTQLPLEQQKKLPRYPSIPAVRMGRLAIAQQYQHQGIGKLLLVDALRRSVQSDIMAYALLVDAKDETVAKFYQHYGFIPFVEQALSLFLPLATVKGLIHTPPL